MASYEPDNHSIDWIGSAIIAGLLVWAVILVIIQVLIAMGRSL